MKSKYSIADFLEIKSAFGARISYSKKYVIYQSNLTGTSQIYLKNLETDTVEQITSYEDPVGVVGHSPIKDDFIFSKAVGGNEKYQLYLYDIETRQTKRLTTKDEFIFHFGGWSRDGKFITFSSNERNGTDFDVFLMDMETSQITPLYTEGGMCFGLNFSPDGSMAAIRLHKTNVNQELFLVDIDTLIKRHITPHTGDIEYGAPQWLPDSSGFYYRTNEASEFKHLIFFDLKTGTKTKILETDWDVTSAIITRDGSTMIVSTNEDGYTKNKFYRLPDFKEITDIKLPEGDCGGFTWSVDSSVLAFSFGTYNAPRNICLWSRETNTYRQLTNIVSVVPADVFVKEELVHFDTFDGRKIPAFVYFPRNRGNKMPVLINIHGGPEAQYRPGFTPLAQYLAHCGYIVVCPNVRGSAGYGKQYLALDDVQKRMDSVEDLRYLHKYLTGLKSVDPNKIALMGASYGGYMVLAGLTFQSELWAAGVDIVGIANFITFLENTSPYRRALREAEYGSLKDHREFLKSISPYNFVENIRAPLFIIHGANDPRVPLSEAEQMEKKLKELGRSVKLLVYNDEGHGLHKLKNKLNAYPKVVSFLEEHLSKN